jgi:hypothetical protein
VSLISRVLLRRVPFALVPLAGLVTAIGIRTRRRRPSARELMRMDDQAFAAFIQGTGIRTVSTARAAQGPAD